MRPDTRQRTYASFTHKDANLRFATDRPAAVRTSIVEERRRLEAYIAMAPRFASSLVPVELLPTAPECARRMAAAAKATGLGPMAAVAGTMAQLAAEAALAAGATEAIVENGGDLFAAAATSVTVGLYAGSSPLSGRLALALSPDNLPLALCSSSGKMGHSQSFGTCDLATVVARDAALADAAATLTGNLVRGAGDLDVALERVAAIPGVQGVLVIVGDRLGMAGRLPRLVRQRDATLPDKITRDRRSGLLL